MTKITIPEKYKDGSPIMEGDIIAEGNVGDIIWDGKGIIRVRPLGVVIVAPRKKLTKDNTILDKCEFYNAKQIRIGKVEITDKFKEWYGKIVDVADSEKIMDFHLSTWDGGFYAWDDVEKVGSIYDFKD